MAIGKVIESLREGYPPFKEVECTGNFIEQIQYLNCKFKTSLEELSESDYARMQATREVFMSKLNKIFQDIIYAIKLFKDGKEKEAEDIIFGYFYDIKSDHYIKSRILIGRDPRTRFFCKVRSEKEEQQIFQKGLFHIDYNSGREPSISRYSLRGHHMLYLATDYKLARCEVEKDEDEYFYVMGYLMDENINTISFKYPHICDFGADNLLKCPFIYASSMSVDKTNIGNTEVVDEYIIPQLLMRGLMRQEKNPVLVKGKRIYVDGIEFDSACFQYHEDPEAEFGHNLVLLPANIKDGLSERLISIFKLTRPVEIRRGEDERKVNDILFNSEKDYLNGWLKNKGAINIKDMPEYILENYDTFRDELISIFDLDKWCEQIHLFTSPYKIINKFPGFGGMMYSMFDMEYINISLHRLAEELDGIIDIDILINKYPHAIKTNDVKSIEFLRKRLQNIYLNP